MTYSEFLDRAIAGASKSVKEKRPADTRNPAGDRAELQMLAGMESCRGKHPSEIMEAAKGCWKTIGHSNTQTCFGLGVLAIWDVVQGHILVTGGKPAGVNPIDLKPTWFGLEMARQILTGKQPPESVKPEV